MQDLKSLPKVELHCHLEACFRISTLKEVAKTLGIDLPSSDEEIRRELLVTEPISSLEAVIKKFHKIASFWGSEEIIERITYETCEDAVAQGIRILELRYDPPFIYSWHPQLSMEKIHRAVTKGVERARKELPLAVGVIGIIQRTQPLEEAEKVADFFIENKQSLIGMDLANIEVGFDCRRFAPLFVKAKKAGLHITVHSGEEDVPEAPKFVRDAIEELGAERIGHGFQIIKDPEMVTFVRERKIPLELCVSSNWLTRNVATTAEHPIRQLMAAGVGVTINSDDPSAFGIDLIHEYELLAKEHGFQVEEFERCNDLAASCSFIPFEDKQKAWPRPII